MNFLFVDIRKRVGNLETPHYAVERLMEVLSEKDIPSTLAHYDEISIYIQDDTFHIDVKGQPLDEFTHVIMRGHRTDYDFMLKKYIVSYAKRAGIKVQNADFIEILPHYNKLIQMEMLGSAGLPYVDAHYSVGGRYWEDAEALKRIGFPLIYKHTEGEYRIDIIDGKPKTKKNVYLVNNKKELQEECERRDSPQETYLDKPSKYFLQKYVDIGEDYRAIMIGGKFLSGWKRAATGSFLTVAKGEYSLYDKPDEEFLKLAEDTNALFKADYCAVDILYVDKKPYVLEINMNPGFKAFETKLEGCDVDVAKAIIEEMLEK